MTAGVTRRVFAKQLGLAAIGAQVSVHCLGGPGEVVASSQVANGIVRVTRGSVDLVAPPDLPAGAKWRYGLVLPFQVAPRKAAAFVNVRVRDGVLAPGEGDYEVGVDVILFDKISSIRPNSPVILTRNHRQSNPKSDPPGQAAVMVKYPARGGFVPLAAKRADGTLHPHAGTGFATLVALSRRLGDAKTLAAGPSFPEDQAHQLLEVHQLSYDGTDFKVDSSLRMLPDDLLPPWRITNGGLSNAIADGDELLVGMTGGKQGERGGSGVMRWRRAGGQWVAVSFVPVTGNDGSSESSLIRDVDGSLLFSARGNGEPDCYDIRVWRSQDGGQTWAKCLHVRGATSIAPITLNQAADGTPYVASNIYLVPTESIPPRFRIPRDAKGRLRGGGWTRQRLYLWPLSEDRRRLETPLLARDCRSEFGAPPGGSMWRVDHPSATTVQLADGSWSNVIGYRVHEDVESPDLQPPPQTGAYLESVISSGRPIPAWRF